MSSLLLTLSACLLSIVRSFSWDVIPSNAFPGFINRAFTSADWAYFSGFASLDICAVNVSCADGTPADCPPPNGYPCKCGSGHEFEANMEAMTIAFADSAFALVQGPQRSRTCTSLHLRRGFRAAQNSTAPRMPTSGWSMPRGGRS